MTAYTEEVSGDYSDSVGVIKFNLLADETASVRLPVVKYEPVTCTTLTWKVFRKSDDLDISISMPSVFKVDSESSTGL